MKTFPALWLLSAQLPFRSRLTYCRLIEMVFVFVLFKINLCFSNSTIDLQIPICIFFHLILLLFPDVNFELLSIKRSVSVVERWLCETKQTVGNGAEVGNFLYDVARQAEQTYLYGHERQTNWVVLIDNETLLTQNTAWV